jgi:hypothetical protein
MCFAKEPKDNEKCLVIRLQNMRSFFPEFRHLCRCTFVPFVRTKIPVTNFTVKARTLSHSVSGKMR